MQHPASVALMVLTVALAATLAYSVAVNVLFRAERGPSFEEAYTLLSALKSGRASLPFNVEIFGEEILNVTLLIDGDAYSFNASKVYVIFKASSAPRLEGKELTLWRVWGNTTHAGVVSLIEVEDDGLNLSLRFASFSGRTETRVIRLGSEKLVLNRVANGGAVFVNGVEVYSWKGYRNLYVYRVEVIADKK